MGWSPCSAVALVLGPETKTGDVTLSSTGHGYQYDTIHTCGIWVALHAALVADENLGAMLEPARTYGTYSKTSNVRQRQRSTLKWLWVNIQAMTSVLGLTTYCVVVRRLNFHNLQYNLSKKTDINPIICLEKLRAQPGYQSRSLSYLPLGMSRIEI